LWSRVPARPVFSFPLSLESPFWGHVWDVQDLDGAAGHFHPLIKQSRIQQRFRFRIKVRTKKSLVYVFWQLRLWLDRCVLWPSVWGAVGWQRNEWQQGQDRGMAEANSESCKESELNIFPSTVRDLVQ
jgi:hypothetical protein